MDHGEQYPFVCLQSRHQEGALQPLLDLSGQHPGAFLLSDSADRTVLHDAHDAAPVHSSAVPGIAAGRHAVYAEAPR